MRVIAGILFLMVLVAGIGTIAASDTGLTTNNVFILGSQSEDLCEVSYMYSYVANANTGVLHRSSCSYIGRMADYNKVYYNSRTAAVNDGYRPCKVCSP